MLTKYNKNLGQ